MKIMKRALYDYSSSGFENKNGEKDISFSKGDIANVLDFRNQWLFVELNGQKGLVPKNYFEDYSEKKTLPPAPKAPPVRQEETTEEVKSSNEKTFDKNNDEISQIFIRALSPPKVRMNPSSSSMNLRTNVSPPPSRPKKQVVMKSVSSSSINSDFSENSSLPSFNRLSSRASMVSDDDISEEELMIARENAIHARALRKSYYIPAMKHQSFDAKDEEQLIIVQKAIRRHLGKNLRNKLLKLSNNRKKIVEEMLETEKTYVDNLQLILELYLKPLQAEYAKVKLTKGDVAIIFSNIELIWQLHFIILDKLDFKFNNWFHQQKIADIFNQILESLKVYIMFVNNYDNALKLLREKLDESTAFRKFVQKAKEDPRCHSLDLESLLICPVQRLPRIELLLTQLLNNTWQDHEDFDDLKKAVGTIKKITTHVNERKKENQNIDKVLTFHKKFEIGVKPHRRFVKEGVLTHIVGKEIHSKPKKKYVVAFNDILVVTEFRRVARSVFSKEKTLRFGKELTFGFEHCVAIDLGGTSFKLEASEGEIFFKAATEEEKDSWVKVLQTEIEKYKERPSKV